MSIFATQSSLGIIQLIPTAAASNTNLSLSTTLTSDSVLLDTTTNGSCVGGPCNTNTALSGNIALTETVAGYIATNDAIVLTVPVGLEFDLSSGNPSILLSDGGLGGTDTLLFSAPTITNSNRSITIAVTSRIGNSERDVLTISNLHVKTNLTTPSLGNAITVQFWDNSGSIFDNPAGNTVDAINVVAGAVTSLTVSTQPVPPTSAGLFGTQPVVTLKDQFNNTCSTGPSATTSVVASAFDGNWTIGGTLTKAAVAGVATFTNLTATTVTPGSDKVHFADGGISVDSSAFTLPNLPAKTFTADATNNDVDHDIDVTYASDETWRAAITAVKIGSTTLEAGATKDYETSDGHIIFHPATTTSANTALMHTPGSWSITVVATTYDNSTVSQTVNAGTVTALIVSTQPVPPASAGLFGTQPIVTLKDQFSNTCSTGPSATANVVASAFDAGWTIGGTLTQAAVAGVATFTDLTTTTVTPGTDKIHFVRGAVTVDSSAFTLPSLPAKTLTADATNNDVDHDIDVTYASDETWRGDISAVKIGSTTLEAGATKDYETSDGHIIFHPATTTSANLSVMHTAGSWSITVLSTGYTNSTVSQTINAGAVASLIVSTPPVPGLQGAVFGTQPIVTLKDQFNNTCSTGPSATSNIVASAFDANWTIGGTLTKAAVAGVATFTNLTATTVTAGTDKITFTGDNTSTIDSSVFTLPNLGATTLTADATNNDVDHDIDVTFGSNEAWRTAISAVKIGSTTLEAGATKDYETSDGHIIFHPATTTSANTALMHTPGSWSITVVATGYDNSTVSQTINAGAVASLTVSVQPVPGAQGAVFGTQPVVTLKDQFNNTCSTGPSATANVVASAQDANWSIGGTLTQAAVAGVATFTDLTLTATSPSTTSQIHFARGGVTVNSSTFTVPNITGKVLTADATNNDVDHDIDVTYGADATWLGAITAVKIGTTTLESGATKDYELSAGHIIFHPATTTSSNTGILQTPSSWSITVVATGYDNSTVSQTITAGAAASLTVSVQPVPGAQGAVFGAQPVIILKDQFNNVCATGPSATANVVASAQDTNWSIGGTLTQAAVAGVATFTDLTITATAPSTTSQMHFARGGVTVNSTTFTVPTIAATTLTADATNNDVDHDIDVTFGSNETWRTHITAVKIGTTTLESGATKDYETSDGHIVFHPATTTSSNTGILQTPGAWSITVVATGYVDSTTSQTINAGTVASLTVSMQPVRGIQGETLSTQPVVILKDQFNNVCTTGPSATANVVASAFDAGWTIGGTLTKAAVAGTATFTDLTATTVTPGTNKIHFARGGVTANSALFLLPDLPTTQLFLTASASTLPTTGTSTITITGEDSFGNPITTDSTTSYTLSIDSDGRLSTLTGALLYGSGTATLTKPTAGVVHVTAQSSGLTTNNLTVTFTAVDTTAPSFVSSTPTNAATSVSVASGTASLVYDENLTLVDQTKVLIRKASDLSSVKSGVASVSTNTLSVAYTALEYNTTYRLTVQSGALSDASSNVVTGDRDIYFTTQSASAPAITSLAISGVSSSGATLTYTTDTTPTTSQYRISTLAYSGSYSTLASSPATLTGLTASTTYYYQVRFVKNGQTVESVPMTFRTASADTGVSVTRIDRIVNDLTVGGDYTSGYHFRFYVTDNSLTETGVSLKLADWTNGSSGLAITSNTVLAVSANGYDTYAAASGSTVAVTNTYDTYVDMSSFDSDTTTGGRQFVVDIFYKIPSTASGVYSTSYGIKTQ